MRTRYYRALLLYARITTSSSITTGIHDKSMAHMGRDEVLAVGFTLTATRGQVQARHGGGRRLSRGNADQILRASNSSTLAPTEPEDLPHPLHLSIRRRKTCPSHTVSGVVSCYTGT
jgi:hypothetical protein